MGGEETAGAGVIKFMFVITLDSLDRSPELSFHIGKEISKRVDSVRFESNGKGP
jgi:hypothetical protein